MRWACRRGLLTAGLLLAGLLAGAAAENVGPVKSEPSAGSIEITANGLRIQPSARLNYLRFQNGVRITGEGFSLRADTVEIDVAIDRMLDTSTVQLPSLQDPPERVIADPGTAVKQMAKEIRGPSARLDASAIRRIAASGKVQISGPGLQLATDTLYSTDGGASWSTGGTSRLTLDDKRRGQSGSFSARLMSFNTEAQTLLARGELSGTLKQPGQDPLSIRAGELQADLKRNTVEIRGGLQLTLGGLELSTRGQGSGAAPVQLDLSSKQLVLKGGFALSDAARGLTVEGGGLSGSLGDGQQVEVSGGVTLADGARGLRLTAERLSAVLEPLRLTASGKVHLAYGKSSYEAQEAVVTRRGDGADTKYIVEINGPQTGRIDLEELQPGK